MTFPRAASRSLWVYYFFYVGVTVIAFLLILLFARQLFKTFYLEQLTTGITQQVQQHVSDPESCSRIARQLGAAVAIVQFDAKPICQTNHEVAQSVDRYFVQARNSLTEQQPFWYRESRHHGALHILFSVGASDHLFVYIVSPLEAAYAELDQVIFKLLLVVLAAVVLITALGFVLYRHVNPPLEEMRRGAARFARGDFTRTLRRYRIAEIDSLSLSLNKMARQLDRIDKVRGDFISNVSHELRTPITSINGFIETLLDGAVDDPDNAKRFLRIVKTQSQRLTNIIVDLLTLARLEDERTQESLILQEEDLQSVLEEVFESCAPHAEQQQIGLTIQSESGLSAVIDRSLIVQAMNNLVENAIKYSGEGKEILLTAQSDESQYVCLSVKDQGIGIARQHLNRLFERFYRVDRARSRDLGGTGLGLAIVKHIAQVHSGSVEVESEIGVGSCFVIRLPRYAMAE